MSFFISVIIDLHNREVIDFAVSTHPNADLVEVTIQQAMKARGFRDLKQEVLHLDQGSIYSFFFALSASGRAQVHPEHVPKSELLG